MAIKDKALIEVYNNSTGSVSFYSNIARIKRSWDKPDIVKKIAFEELRELVGEAGGYDLLVEVLLIKDNSARLELGLPMNPEYLMGDKEVAEALDKPLNEFKNIVEIAPKPVVEKMAMKAIETELSDINKMDAIKEKTGIDVLSAIREAQDDRKIKATKESK